MAYKFAYVIFLLYFCGGKCFGFSESGKFTVSKALKHYMNHMAWIVVLLFGYQGIPEPRKAKQQDFNPAFCINAG